MKNPILALCILAAVLCVNSCQVLPLSMVDTGKLNKLIEMGKGPCYGQCPVFTITVYDNGVMSYQGKRYTDKMGTYLKRLTKAELDGLAAAFRRADLWQYADVYRSDYPDLPAVSISYYEAERSKTILGKETRPEAVIELEGRLNALANAEGWVLRSAPDYGLPAGSIPNQLLVELKQDTDPEAWVRNYSKQEMKLLKKIWPSNTKLIVSYNLKVVAPDYMIDLVRQDADVVSVEFNKK